MEEVETALEATCVPSSACLATAALAASELLPTLLLAVPFPFREDGPRYDPWVSSRAHLVSCILLSASLVAS